MCSKCEWESYSVKIDAALEDAKSVTCDEAASFIESVTSKLTSIGEWVQKNSHITEAQETAVDNMAEGIDLWLDK